MHSLENEEKFVRMRQLQILQEKARGDIKKFFERHVEVL